MKVEVNRDQNILQSCSLAALADLDLPEKTSVNNLLQAVVSSCAS